MSGQGAQVFHLLDHDGEIHEVTECPRCADYKSARDKALFDVVADEKQITRLAAEVERLKRDRMSEHEVSPHRAMIEGLFEFWQQVTGHTRAAMDFGEASAFEKMERRWRNLRDMEPEGNFPGLTREEQMRLAILGAGLDPYVDPKKKRHDGIDLIFNRGNEKVYDFARRAVTWGKRHMA